MKYFAVLFIKIYQLFVSPLLGPRCRFYPTCSHYALGVYRTFHFFKASQLTFSRLSRCHPWNNGGIDYPPFKTDLLSEKKSSK
jgi:putative membrane protein insertion efficiency factor